MSFFGKNVKKIRGLKKMSQQAFAGIFELKRATLGAYEEGRSEPKIETIIKVANYFSIPIDKLLTKEITIHELVNFDDEITTNINQLIRSSLTQVPYINDLNKTLFINEFPTQQDYQFLPQLLLPIKKQEGLLAFEVQDLIMAAGDEGLYPGDLVIAQQTTINEINNLDVVLVLVDSKLHLRRISKNKNEINLSADHIHIDPITISNDEKVCIWKVIEVMIKRYPKFSDKLS